MRVTIIGLKSSKVTHLRRSTVHNLTVELDFTPDSFPDLTGLRQFAKQPGFHVSTVMSSTSMSDLVRTARKLNVTPLAVVQAAWASILVRISFSVARILLIFG